MNPNFPAQFKIIEEGGSVHWFCHEHARLESLTGDAKAIPIRDAQISCEECFANRVNS